MLRKVVYSNPSHLEDKGFMSQSPSSQEDGGLLPQSPFPYLSGGRGFYKEGEGNRTETKEGG